MKRAAADGWGKLRRETDSKATAEAQQKKIASVVSNAAKLERAKGLALDWLNNALSAVPQKTGSHIRQSWKDDKGKQNSVDFDLLDMVNVIVKLESGEPEAESEALKRAREILGGVHSAID